MASIREYQFAKARCERHAEHAPDDETRAAWLNLAQTYGTLVMLEAMECRGALIGGERPE